MKTFFYKNFRALILAASGISLYFAVSILFLADSLYYESSIRNLRQTAEAIVFSLPTGLPQGYFEEREDEAAAWLAGLPAASPYRLSLIRRDGSVLADSRLDSAGAVNHSDRSEVRSALAGIPGEARRRSLSLGEEFIYAALPVYGADGTVAGVFRVSRVIQSFQRRLSSRVVPFLGCGVLVILGVFAGLYAFSRFLTRPLRDLAAAAHSFYDRRESAVPPGGQRQSAVYGIREFDLLDQALRAMTTELKARLEKAQAEGRRLEAILNGMDEAVLALDGKLNLRMVNPRARALLGLAQRNFDADSPPSLLEAGCPGELEEAAKTALAERKALERELRLHIAGKPRYFRLFAAPMDGNGGGIVMVLGDLTRLHKLERVRKDFAANVSHELRTPIQLIKGYSETLLETMPAPADQEQLRRGIEIIRKNALTMENLTNDLLSLVSLEDENQPWTEMGEVKVRDLLDEAVSAVEPEAAKKNIRVHRQCDGELSARLHGTFMVQALINLLDNAVKYSPPWSNVWLEASTGQGETPELLITVRDQGIGIPAEHQGRIFERFYRVDKSRGRGQGGTGLGLAIVRHIALIHQGSVEVESHAGEGSAFRLRIPNPGTSI